jgi:HD superfamily phosphohydrolase
MSRITSRLGLGTEETAKLRLAALLHDVGQYPLSHVIESVYRQLGLPLEELFENKERVRDFEALPSLQKAAIRPSGDFGRDKSLAIRVIQERPDLQEVFEEHGLDGQFVKAVVDMIAGRHTLTLYRHLLDSDYDCDRLDYVVRDAQLAGVRYGLVDIDYLVENMSAQRYRLSEDKVLAVHRRKALHTLEHYLTARYYMYSQIIFHKTIRSLELIAKAIAFELAARGRLYPNFDKIAEIVPDDEFLFFDDSYFFHACHEYYRSAPDDDRLKGLIGRLFRRQPLNFVAEFKDLTEDFDTLRADYVTARNHLTETVNLKHLAEDSCIPVDRIVAEELVLDLVPIGSDVRIKDILRDPEATTKAVMNSPWLYDGDRNDIAPLLSEKSSLLYPLSSNRLFVLRLYLDGDDAEANRLRSCLRTRGVAV